MLWTLKTVSEFFGRKYFYSKFDLSLQGHSSLPLGFNFRAAYLSFSVSFSNSVILNQKLLGFNELA